jgi:epoxyqueuosine reductase
MVKNVSNDAEIEQQQQELERLLLSSGAQFIGFADLSTLDRSITNTFPIAISIGIAYDPRIIAALDTDIEAFEHHFNHTKQRMRQLLALCTQYLHQRGYHTWIPPISTNRPGLRSEFSHKLAATRAGLGWIGKSSLFVSPDVGCAVCLATALTTAPFQPGTPVTVSQCGECMNCVQACPYQAIKGVNWYPGIARDALFDAYLCSRRREAFIPQLGYKHPCGLCIQACPFG